MTLINACLASPESTHFDSGPPDSASAHAVRVHPARAHPARANPANTHQARSSSKRADATGIGSSGARAVIEAMANNELLAGLRAGDEASYATLIRLHHDRLVAVGCRYLPREEACDVVQESFVKTFESIACFRGDSELSTWLHRVVVNGCISRLRKADKLHERAVDSQALEVLAEAVDSCSFEPCPESLLASVELQQLCRRHIECLPLVYRTVLMMRDIDGFSGKEVALALGITVNLVKVRLHRARQALRRSLNSSIGHHLDVR